MEKKELSRLLTAKVSLPKSWRVLMVFAEGILGERDTDQKGSRTSSILPDEHLQNIYIFPPGKVAQWRSWLDRLVGIVSSERRFFCLPTLFSSHHHVELSTSLFSPFPLAALLQIGNFSAMDCLCTLHDYCAESISPAALLAKSSVFTTPIAAGIGGFMYHASCLVWCPTNSWWRVFTLFVFQCYTSKH